VTGHGLPARVERCRRNAPRTSRCSSERRMEGIMIAGARYGHTNLIARDWRALASFYEQLFGCAPVPLSGTTQARARGRNRSQRNDSARRSSPSARPRPRVHAGDLLLQHHCRRSPSGGQSTGFAHIAFVVPDVAAARTESFALAARHSARSSCFKPRSVPASLVLHERSRRQRHRAPVVVLTCASPEVASRRCRTHNRITTP